jgi:hypothetical protein
VVLGCAQSVHRTAEQVELHRGLRRHRCAAQDDTARHVSDDSTPHLCRSLPSCVCTSVSVSQKLVSREYAVGVGAKVLD